jgi:NDP-sugar pyrophosphorylase family protein
MKAMILAAGLGTRFKPWTDKHPKALAVINKKTLLQRAIEYLQQYKIWDVVVNVHHFASQIEEAIEYFSSLVLTNQQKNFIHRKASSSYPSPHGEGGQTIKQLSTSVLTNHQKNFT